MRFLAVTVVNLSIFIYICICFTFTPFYAEEDKDVDILLNRRWQIRTLFHYSVMRRSMTYWNETSSPPNDKMNERNNLIINLNILHVANLLIEISSIKIDVLDCPRKNATVSKKARDCSRQTIFRTLS